MKKIILMGNPNVGKSVIFSRLTGANVIASNYPGTTVDYYKGRMKIGNERYEIIDAPGTYSLTPTNKAEEVAAKIVKDGNIIINVVDATNLERNLYLTLELLELGKPMVVALNMWDETAHKGIHINVEKLEKILGVPVIPTVGLSGEGIKKLVNKIRVIKPRKVKKLSEKEKWCKIGKIVKQLQKIEYKKHTIREIIEEMTIRPVTGLPIALGVILFSFYLVRLIGESLINYVFNPLFQMYKPLVLSVSSSLGPGLIHDILVGKLVGGDIDFMESLGMLTTGLYVPFAGVLPYIIAFYFVLSILEDSGYLPRLATLLDNVFHKLGMHGQSVVTVLLGLGCNVPGALSTRIMESRRQRFISATLMAIAVPCMAQTAMVFGILGSYGAFYISIVFLTLAIVYVAMGLLLNRFIKGESEEIFLEIPPYRVPSFYAIIKKTWMRIRWFLQDAIPWLFFGVAVVNILYAVGFIDWLGNLLAPIVQGLFGLPKDAAIALLAGFLRKDLAVGMLIPLHLSPYQLVIAVTILTVYFPCVATFTVLLKEFGLKDMLKSTIIMITTAIIVGTILRIALLGF